MLAHQGGYVQCICCVGFYDRFETQPFFNIKLKGQIKNVSALSSH